MTEKIAANASRALPPASKFITLVGDYGTADFKLHRGGVLQEVVVAY